jgi:peptidoglycan/LPS O-acetylase OafA/YrhL
VLLVVELSTSNTVLHIPAADVLFPLPFFGTLTQSWFYHRLTYGASVVYAYPRATIDWSISTEMLMYALYPGILWFLLRDRFSPMIRTACATMVVVLISLGLSWMNLHLDSVDTVIVRMFGQQAGLQSSGGYSATIWFAFLSPYTRIFEFLIGALTAHCFLSSEATKTRSRYEKVTLVLAGAAMIAIAGSFLPPMTGITWFASLRQLIGYCPLISVIIYACARFPNSFVERFFSFRPFVFLGKCSYSIYLFHIFIYSAVEHGPSSGWVTASRICIAWTAIFACAVALYNYLEMPLRKWMHGRLMAAIVRSA